MTECRDDGLLSSESSSGIALVLLVVGIAVETLEFLLYIGFVVLVWLAVLFLFRRVRSGSRKL